MKSPGPMLPGSPPAGGPRHTPTERRTTHGKAAASLLPQRQASRAPDDPIEPEQGERDVGLKIVPT